MSYICSIKLKTVINMKTKKFAEENVGKFFMYGAILITRTSSRIKRKLHVFGMPRFVH